VGKSSSGEQNGKEILKEVEEAGSDEAAYCIQEPSRSSTRQNLGPIYDVRGALMDTTRPQKSMENSKQGRYLASGPAWGPTIPVGTLNRAKEIMLWQKVPNQ